MATGLSIPLRVNGNGGFQLSSGSEQDNNVISLSLASDDNDNAFEQNLGLGESMIFDLTDPTSRARITAALRRLFEGFEQAKRFKLLEATIRWQENEQNGEVTLSFKYVALETDKEQDFTRTYLSAEAGASSDSSSNG